MHLARKDDEEDYDALKLHFKRINQLASMERIKDRDDEDRVRCLTHAVSRTERGLYAQKIPVEPSFQRLTNALYIYIQELGTYQQLATFVQNNEAPREFWKSL